MTKYLSTEQIAEQLSVSSETVRNWLASGELAPFIRIGGPNRPRYRVSENVVKRFIRSRQLKAKA